MKYVARQKLQKITRIVRYGLFLTGSYLSSRAASSQVLSTCKGLTAVFGMGTGGTP
jgi:hypothetical protein